MSENLAAKYRPRTFNDVTEQSIVVDIVKNICTSGDISNRNFLFTGSAGCGKAQPNDSLVLTPDGYIEMGDIKAGCMVFTRYGDVAEVTDVFPQGKRQIYTINLSDGSKIRVADNHLNLVYQNINDQKREYILDTMELIDRCKEARSDCKFYVDSVTIPEYSSSQTLRMNPYLAGVLCASYRINDNYFEFRLKNVTDTKEIELILLQDYNIKLSKDFKKHQVSDVYTDYTCEFPPSGLTSCFSRGYTLFFEHLKEYLTLGTGTIQPCVIYQSLAYRLEFIRGIEDGAIRPHVLTTRAVVGTNVLSTILRSSGYVDNVKTVQLDSGFISHHKFKKASDGGKREIVSIVADGQEDCTCIYVDNPDHTYITDYMTPTHNTTIARIIANELNEGKGEPIEIDAASHNGTESVREIVNQARTYPIGCNWKVFILDEAHSFSANAWQVWLKTLEEQPARSIFMFATTNPEKIPATILSRVQTFQLSKISLNGIYQRLKYIIDCEIKEGRHIEADDDAIRFLAKLAEGGMRNGITLLDKTLSYSNKVTLDVLQKSLGLPNYDKYFELLNAVAKKDNETIISIINDVYNSGLNFVKWFEGFFGFITNIVKYIYLKDISQTIIPVTYQDKIQNYGPAHTVICLKLSNTLLKMNYELKSSQYLQEIAISYLCTLPQVKK